MAGKWQRGDRVRLVRTSDPHTDLQPGDLGTVMYYQEGTMGSTIHMRWDRGSTMAILPSEGDVIEKAEEEEPAHG